MDGFGNTSGFSTTFGASPFREKLTGYEDIYGEQLGQPALNNLKAPEIEAYKNALTESPDFTPFMQQRKRILDLATKAQGAGLNINNPRTQDEVEYALLFNQEVEKYNDLGRRLEMERENQKQFREMLGKENIAAVAPERYTTREMFESYAPVVSAQDIRLAYPNKGFTTQGEADAYNAQIEDDLMAIGLSIEAIKDPEVREKAMMMMGQRTPLAGRGTIDQEKVRKLNLQAERNAISRSKGSGSGSDAPVADLTTAWQNDYFSNSPSKVKTALQFAGYQKLPIYDSEGKEKKAVAAFPLAYVSGDEKGKFSNNIVISDDPQLENNMISGKIVMENGKLYNVSSTGRKTDYTGAYSVLDRDVYFNYLRGNVAEEKGSYEGFLTTVNKGLARQGSKTTEPKKEESTPKPKPKIDY